MATGGAFTQEFAHEFETERGRWLRKRFLWYAGVVVGFSLLSTLIGLPMMLLGFTEFPRSFFVALLATIFIASIGTVLYIISFFKVYRNQPTKDQILKRVHWLIIISGLLSLLASVASNEINRPGAMAAYQGLDAARARLAELTTPAPGDAEPGEGTQDSGEAVDHSGAEPTVAPDELAAARQAEREARDRVRLYFGNFSRTDGVRALTIGVGGAANIFFSHFFACLFLPWSPRESSRPLIPLFFANAALTIFYGVGEWVPVILSILLSPLVAVPGLLICWFRYSRFRNRFSHSMLKHRYSEVRRELVDARRIHESLFPKSITDGPIRFHYHYEPMRQIGGDFLYARPVMIPGHMHPVLDIAIIDVTGHGISAALTVNRLFGELERLYAEHPAIAPGKLLTGLNSYIHNTLASHSVYATALCVRIDANEDRLTWASAGHPPAFVRGVDGTIHQLNSTTFVLGACHGNDFGAHPESMHFAAGDVLIAYTDGAIEARSITGAMLRVEGLMGMIHSCRGTEAGSVGQRLVEALLHFRHGNALDDTLFVEVFRPVPSRTGDHAPLSAAAKH